MKTFWMVLMILLMVFVTNAQSTSDITCGDTISDHFSVDDLNHRYNIDISVGTILVVHALPIETPLNLTLEILNANGALIGANDFSPDDSAVSIETSAILAAGTYHIDIAADDSGNYQLFVSCASDEDSEVVSENNLVQGMICGDQIDNTMIRPDELHRYFVFLDEDTVMDVFLESLYGDFGDMTFELGLYSPTNQELDRINADFKDIERTIFEQTATTEGVYRLYVQGFDSTDENYRLSIDCTLPDGSLALSGGDTRRVFEPTQLSASESDTSDTITIVSTIEIIEGLPNTGQLDADTTAITYLFSGENDETISLNYQRVRGEGNVALSIEAPDGEIMFSTSLLWADGLSVDLTLPQSGDYTINLTGLDAVFTVEVVRGS